MTSEIRANTLKNRVGLGTVSFTNTGTVVSGIVTANSFSGPLITTSIDLNGDLDVDGHTNLDNVSIAGVVTATSFVGNLTGTASGNPTLTNGANNRIITATGANALLGEQNLTFDGTQLVVQGGSGTQHMFRHSAGWGGVTSAGSAGGSGAGFSLANNYNGTLETKWSIYLDGSNDGLRFTANTPDQTSDEKVRITAAGDLGIGVVSPTQKLDVSGNGKFNKTGNCNVLIGSTNAGGAAIVLDGDSDGNGSGADYAYIEHDTSGDLNIVATNPADSSSIKFHTGDGSERVKIDSNGNVQIKGTNHQARWYRDDGNRYGAIFYDGGQFTLQNPYNDNFQITKSDGTVLYKFMNSGNMGIGIADPIRQLEIYNSSHATAALKSDTQSSLFFSDPADTNIGQISFMHSGSPNNYMYFRVNDDERLRIDSAGRLIVGGGTHAGGSALVVKGGNQNTYSTIGMFSNHTNPGDNTLLSQIRFGANTSAVGADIRVTADADWANNDYPTRMGFYTTPDGSNSRIERLQIDKDGRTSISKNGWVGNDMSFALTVHTGSTSDSNNAVNDGIMIVSQNNNGNQNSTTGKLMFCGHAQTNGPFIYGKNAQAYGKKDLVFNTRSTANSYTTQLEETARFTYYGALRVNKIEPRDGLDTNAYGGIIQVKWSANVDNANYSSGSDVVMQTVNITPTSNDARILIHVVYPSIRSYTTGNTRNRLNQHIKRNGTEIYSLPEMPQWRGANFAGSGVEINHNVAFTHIDSPSTTSQVTYTATWSSVDGHVWNTASAQMTMICAELTGY